MKRAFLAVLVVAVTGCVMPPVQIRSAPAPLKQDLPAMIAMQSRTLNVETNDVFPRVLTVLLNGGYVIRSASKELGYVSFYQQWSDASQAGANITQEGTAVFVNAGPHQTSVRIAVTGGWQRLQATGGGPKSTDYGMVGGVQMSATPDEYTRLLDLIETGLLDK
jgi:hypothetical protein